jgi:hypothetical protein
MLYYYYYVIFLVRTETFMGTAKGKKTLHSMNRTQITKEKYGDTKLLSSSRS